MRLRHLTTALVLAAALLYTAVAAGATADSWQVEATPSVAGQSDVVLDGVACTSSTSCRAVGGYASSMWTEAWSGSSWGPAQRLSAAGADRHNLSGIACPTVTDCIAVGSSGSQTASDAFVDRYSGGTWTAANPTTGGSEIDGALTGVSCSSADACTAVGYDVTTEAAIIERYDGQTWTQEASAPPYGFLDAVSCPTADSCEASGWYESGPEEVPLVERWNGTAWTEQHAPAESGAGTSYLDGISCTSATSCLAVGSWTPSTFTASGIHVLLERYDGTAWTLLSDPDPALPLAGLSSISCIGPSICSAVGASGSTGAYKVLAERWDGSTWAVRTSQDVGAASGLSSVACVPGICRAVGQSVDSGTAGGTVPLGEAN